MAGRTRLLAASWSTVAEGYEREMSSRFEPWIAETIAEVTRRHLPPGPIYSLACGPGPELVALAKAFPSRAIVGVDVAEGMVRRARAAVLEAGLQDRVVVRVGDAMEEPAAAGTGDEGGRGAKGGSALAERGAALSAPRPAAIICCFALNQLPEPPAALERWARSLAPGGVVAVAYWPGAVEDEGPWRRLTDLTLGVRVQDRAMRNVIAWLPAAASAGLTLRRDSTSSHAMTWPGGAAQFWEVLTRQGAWHARRLAKGDEDMERVRSAFLQAYSDPEKPLEHWPKARVIVIQKSTEERKGDGEPGRARL